MGLVILEFPLKINFTKLAAYMHIKRLLFFCGLLFMGFYSFSQSISKKVNTESAENYFKIATLLKNDQQVVESQWQSLFQTPIYQMMIAGKAIDTIYLKEAMHSIFGSKNMAVKKPLPSKEIYHQFYKDNQTKLEVYIKLLHTANTVDSVKALVYPFLPKRLQKESLFPKLYYLNYGKPEATGYGGIVINDLLHSYQIDSYKFGLLAAHEAFHAIVSVAFHQSLKPSIDYNDPSFNLLYFLQNVSEEGIADLIDKSLLMKRSSPVYLEVSQLIENDESLSIKYISSLDSLLKHAFVSENVLQSYNSFPLFANAFGKNGGHIPGRFMGMTIMQSGLLQNHIMSIEDPIAFVLTYNESVEKSKSKYPLFSKESIQYLQKLRTKFLKF